MDCSPRIRTPKHFLSAMASLSILLGSCDESMMEPLPPSPTNAWVTTRILMADLHPAPPVEKLHAILDVSRGSSPRTDTLLSAPAEGSIALLVPIDTAWTVRLEGLRKSSDGSRWVVWWKGGLTRTIASVGDATPDTLLAVFGDTTEPTIGNLSGIPSDGDSLLPSGSRSVKFSFRTDPSDSVFVDGAYSNSPDGVHEATRSIPDTIRLRVVDAAGNTKSKVLWYGLAIDTTPPASQTETPVISDLFGDTAATGGNGGWVDTAETMAELKDLASRASKGIIFVKGRIGSYGTFGKRDGDRVVVASDKSILGLPGAVVQGGFDLFSENIILRNLVIEGSGAIADSGDDAISITGRNADRIWIDHCDIRDAQEMAIDMTHTGIMSLLVSHTKFSYSPRSKSGFRSCRMGAPDENYSRIVHSYLVTFYKNWWAEGVRESMPAGRYCAVNLVNNLYTTKDALSAIQSGLAADIVVEANAFLGTHNPIASSHPSFSPNVRRSNLFENTTNDPDKPVRFNDQPVMSLIPYQLDARATPEGLLDELSDTLHGAGATIHAWGP